MRFLTLLVLSSMLLMTGAAPAADDESERALPQRPLFRNFGPAQGLPSSTVHKLAQDRQGNLWIATLDGLARYDGLDFKVWRHDPDDPNSLPGNDVQQVIVTGDDQVWLSIQDAGIARYDAANDRFDQWRHDAAHPEGLSTNSIWAIADDGAGGLWLGGYLSGLSRLHADGRFEHFRYDENDPKSLCDDIILSIVRTDDGRVWIGTFKGLCRWREGEGFALVPVPVVGQQPASRAILDIEPDGDRLWLSTNVGLRAVGGSEPTVPPTLPVMVAGTSGAASVIEPDRELWFGSNDGLRRWNLRTGETTIHRADNGHAMALQVSAFLDILRDREGSLWFATQGGGLAQLLPRWRAIHVFLPNADNPVALPGGRIQTVTADSGGHLWIIASLSTGVGELDPETGIVKRWLTDGDGIKQADPSTLSVLRDHDGLVWTSHRGRMARTSLATGTSRFVGADRNGKAFPETYARRIAQHPDGTIFAAFGGGGIARIDPDNLEASFDSLDEETGPRCTSTSDIQIDSGGAIWLACENGVLRAPDATSPFATVAGAPAHPIDGIAFSDGDRIWLHALGLLAEFRIEDASLAHIRSVTAQDGWPLVKAGGLLVDGDGLVWVTTSRGLYSYEPQSGRIALYDENDGLPSAEFSPTPPARLTPHLFAAGTMSGVVIVDTRLLRTQLPRARLRWHGLSALRGADSLALTPDADVGIALDHDDRDLRLAVRLESLAKPSAHRYRFRLDGYDSDWVEQTGNPERVIEWLPSGNYTLTVQAFGSDGQPALNELIQSIRVGLPPWRQPWAIALYVLAAILLAWLLQHAYRQRLENRHALTLATERQQWAEQTSEAKTRFLASVGHEIRTPMAGLLGMNALLIDSPLNERQHHYARSVKQAGEHMLTLVNDLLDLSRIEAGKLALDADRVDLVALVDETIADVAAAAERKHLVLTVRFEPGASAVVHADGKRLRQILLNFLNNAIKFTPEGHIRLLVNRADERFRFAVEDNGPGLSEEMRQQLFQRYSQDALGRHSGGTGLGLSIAHELALLMEGDIGVDHLDQGGSRFWIEVPLSVEETEKERVGVLPLAFGVIDNDAIRADDLVVSLQSLGAEAWWHDDASARRLDSNWIALIAARDAGHAIDLRVRTGAVEQRYLISLPLADATAHDLDSRRVLPGPWRLSTLFETARSMHADPASPVATVMPDAAGIDLRALRLLLVEDDAILREVLSTRLRAMGAVVIAAEHGLAALGELGTCSFDAVILDLDLPELDGLQVLRLTRERMGDDAPPFVVVTARQHPDDESRCRTAGARDFFRKPVDSNVLARRLLEIVEAGTKSGYGAID